MGTDGYRVCPKCDRRYAGAEARTCESDGTRLLIISASDDPLVGTTLVGKFTVTKLLGKGGFGAVYSGIQHPVEREVAIKVLHKEHASSETQVKRFFLEARSIGRLRSQHTIQLYDFGQADDGALYMAMELAPGEPLSKLIRRERRLGVARAVRILAQVCESLEEAHRHGVIHRDLKPDNIMVEDRHGHPDFVKVLDFGIAKLLDGGEFQSMTASGIIQGTPSYMSPEQVRGQTLTPASDLYSLGVILFQALAGQVPLKRETPMATALAHVTDEPPDLGQLVPSPPARVVALVTALLAKKPADRPSSAEALRAELLEIAGSAPVGEGGTPAGLKPPTTFEFTGSVGATVPFVSGRSPANTSTQAIDTDDGKARSAKWVIAAVVALLLAGVLAYLLARPAADTVLQPLTATATGPTAATPAPVSPVPTAAPDTRRAVTLATVGPGGSVSGPAIGPRALETEWSSVRRRPAAHWSEVSWVVGLSVKTTPPGATVNLSGRVLGKTPGTWKLPYGHGSLSLVVARPGFKPIKKALVPDREVALDLPLAKRRPRAKPRSLPIRVGQ